MSKRLRQKVNREILNNFNYLNYGDFVHSIRTSNIESNFNEIILHSRYISTGLIECFVHDDLHVILTDKIMDNAENYYVIFANKHFNDLKEYFHIFDKKLNDGLKILFINFHETGSYREFYDWVNKNPNKKNIYTISPCYNLNDFVTSNNIFFPYHLYDFDKNFKWDGQYKVCTKEEYLNTQKEKNFLCGN